MSRLRSFAALVALTAAALFGSAPAVGAQGPPLPITRSPDFLLGPPKARLGIRGSWLLPRADGDLFSFVSDQLTLERSDLRGRGIAADLGIVLTPRFDIVVGVDTARREVGSEYRRFIASNGQAITQTTRFKQTAVSLGLRFDPLGNGRRISRLAFIPRRVTPYAGVGLTASFYDFSQRGQFVDFADSSVFNDSFVSDGWVTGPFVHGGADVQAWKRLYVTFDGRYSWLRGALDADFNGFDGIDLAGFRASTGIRVVF